MYTIVSFCFVQSQALLGSALVSPNLVETLNNAEQFMMIRDYRTAAALYTAALQRLGVDVSPELVATILCKRAECLLRLVSIFIAGSKKLVQMLFKETCSVETLFCYTLVTFHVTFTFRIMYNTFCEIVQQVCINSCKLKI